MNLQKLVYCVSIPLLSYILLLDVAACYAGSRPVLEAEVEGSKGDIKVETLSGPPDRISGGDVLVRIRLGRYVGKPFQIRLNVRDVTGSFQQSDPGTLVGLIEKLDVGSNSLQIEVSGATLAALQLTNYPIQGPIVSGPHLKPFICQTQSLLLPDGETLGQAIDADCSIKTRITYIYLSAATGAFKALKNFAELPSDVVRTTTKTGETVNFVVRIETATINRGIFESAVLHDPTIEKEPSPLASPKGWNGVLIGAHGTGCTGGWYVQGGSQSFDVIRESELLNQRRLGEGYAIFVNTLQNPSDSCNAFLAGETAMMGKEHFIKTYGVPRYSISVGSSGGAYTGIQIIDAFPGVFDGALIENTFPDALAIALAAMDARLLRHYFAVTNPGKFADLQQVQISGYQGRQAWYDAASQAARTDPLPHRIDPEGDTSAVWSPAVPLNLRYDPTTNPKGARPTIWDVSRNIYGIESGTRKALRVFDNVGVQYGLAALNIGAISKKQFLDLNEAVGGYDRDDNYTASRTVGDEQAISEAYRSGLQLSGGGGLSEVPVVDFGGTYNESANYHYQWYHFAVRERLTKANGDHDNHVMWRGNTDSDEAVQAQAFEYLNRWIDAIKTDELQLPPREKVRRHRPTALRDGCWNSTHQFVAEEQVFSRHPDSSCNTSWPSFGFPRLIAGSPLAADTLKCTLKPIGLSDYTVSFTREERARLGTIFPKGVCDWSKTGRYFHHVVIGRSYGLAPLAPRLAPVTAATSN